ncbi:hypothetical protein L484_021106 [Morus notabilis]|uniref:Uncharacterized protein n=1 Tax=Morus notabilis TaxID=981085 RepID=W9R9N7_9ROSA|nr:hypothetical protein L484_021106 [Morus notabilis]
MVCSSTNQSMAATAIPQRNRQNFCVSLLQWGRKKRRFPFSRKKRSCFTNVGPNQKSRVQASELENTKDRLRFLLEEKEVANPCNLLKKRTEASKKAEKRPEKPALGSSDERLPATGEKTIFRVRLSQQEVEEDFAKILGRNRLPRPKKRPRKFDRLFPGTLIKEIKKGAYKMPPRVANMVENLPELYVKTTVGQEYKSKVVVVEEKSLLTVLMTIEIMVASSRIQLEARQIQREEMIVE